MSVTIKADYIKFSVKNKHVSFSVLLRHIKKISKFNFMSPRITTCFTQHQTVYDFIFILYFHFSTTLDNFCKSLTVITSNGRTYNNAKLMKSSSFELNWLRSITQISSLISLLVCTFVIVRLKINFGVEYMADFIHTTTITSCN